MELILVRLDEKVLAASSRVGQLDVQVGRILKLNCNHPICLYTINVAIYMNETYTTIHAMSNLYPSCVAQGRRDLFLRTI